MSTRIDPEFIEYEYDSANDDEQHRYDEYVDYNDFEYDRDIDFDDFVDGIE